MHHQPYTLPAEWHPQSGVQLTWPHTDTDWAPYIEEVLPVFRQLALAILQHELLLIVVPDTEEWQACELHRIPQEYHHRLLLAACPSNDTWARDHGGITLIGEQPTVLDFKFNGWGEKFSAQHDNDITQLLHSSGMLHAAYESHQDFVLEGGSIESDGQGTIFTTSFCLLAPHRNQPLSIRQIEQQLIRRLHARRVITLHHGTVIGDDTDGHIDTTVRIAPRNTILYMRPEASDTEQYEDFRLLEEELKALRTIDNHPYRLLPLPAPAPIYHDGERLPATYANFLIINHAVIVPTYGQEADKQAMEVVQEAFPDREIIGIDALPIIRQHGSLHCLTMQYPEGVLKAE